jgi:predicted RNase H-like HicB family nuclease
MPDELTAPPPVQPDFHKPSTYNSRGANLLKAKITQTKRISVALETNGRGFIGFIVQLPGAFVRGKTEDEALSKVDSEVKAYTKWLGAEIPVDYDVHVSQRHSCALTVEDADSEILLDEDKPAMNDREFREFRDLTTYSGETFFALYSGAELRNWVDDSKIRKTFYGETPRTILEIVEHVNGTQYYYLSRVGLKPRERTRDFLQTRRNCLSYLQELFEEQGNDQIFQVDNEKWTLRKVLRRFVWHDRIHAKAIVRMMQKQKRLGLIADFRDPFHFTA